jgi:hypothetical protein
VSFAPPRDKCTQIVNGVGSFPENLRELCASA